MRLTFLSDSDYLGGGGVAAATIGRAIADQLGPFDWIMLRAGSVNEPWHRHLLPAMTDMPITWRALARVAGAAWRDAATVRSHQYNHWIRGLLRARLRELKPDVIQVHSLHVAGWDFEIIACCEEFAPVVYTMHDFWHTTARCMFPYECTQFESGCTATCPTADQHPRLHPAAIHSEWLHRRRIVSNSRRLKGVAVSEYIRRETLRGAWRGADVQVIRNGLNLSQDFRPMSPAEARCKLGIPCDRPVLLIAALSLEDRRKGFSLLLEALRSIPSKEYTILAFGNDNVETLSKQSNFHHLGYLSLESEKRIAYSSADWTVVPSIAETLNMVAVESIACGTPVISFAVGGLPEVVIPGRSGILAGLPGASSLAKALSEALQLSPTTSSLRASCREVAEELFDSRRTAREYIQLYQESVSHRSARA
jgi:glycosyltransferase involved in cell wall biosynthesis